MSHDDEEYNILFGWKEIPSLHADRHVKISDEREAVIVPHDDEDLGVLHQLHVYPHVKKTDEREAVIVPHDDEDLGVLHQLHVYPHVKKIDEREVVTVRHDGENVGVLHDQWKALRLHVYPRVKETDERGLVTVPFEEDELDMLHDQEETLQLHADPHAKRIRPLHPRNHGPPHSEILVHGSRSDGHRAYRLFQSARDQILRSAYLQQRSHGAHICQVLDESQP